MIEKNEWSVHHIPNRKSVWSIEQNHDGYQGDVLIQHLRTPTFVERHLWPDEWVNLLIVVKRCPKMCTLFSNNLLFFVWKLWLLLVYRLFYFLKWCSAAAPRHFTYPPRERDVVPVVCVAGDQRQTGPGHGDILQEQRAWVLRGAVAARAPQLLATERVEVADDRLAAARLHEHLCNKMGEERKTKRAIFLIKKHFLNKKIKFF